MQDRRSSHCVTGVGAVAWWKPQGLIGAAFILGAAWIISLLFNPANRRMQLLGLVFPTLFGATGWAVTSGFPLNNVLGVLGGIGVLGALAIWAAPALGRQLYIGWMYAAQPAGWTISHVVLGIVYYLVLTPIGLLLRLAGRDPLQRRFDREATSYWIKREAPADAARYFRQF